MDYLVSHILWGASFKNSGAEFLYEIRAMKSDISISLLCQHCQHRHLNLVFAAKRVLVSPRLENKS